MAAVGHRPYSGTVYSPNVARGPANSGLYTELYPLPLSQSNSLDIFVKSSSDAEIILFDEIVDKETIKICLGSSGNTTSSIGFYDNAVLAKNFPDKVVQTPKILSSTHVKYFKIYWNYGLIKVFNDGEEKPFLVWRGPSYLYVGWFGFRTNGSYGTWKTQGGGDDIITVQVNDGKAPFQKAKINTGKLEFEVKANSDSMVAITTLPMPFHNPALSPSANFLIGSWNNNRAAIWLNRVEVTHYDKAAIMSPFEFRRFWIKWDAYTIQMGEYGSVIPKMTFTSPTPLYDMRYFGFVNSLPGAVCTGLWHIIDDEVEQDEGYKPEPKAVPTEVKIISTNTRYGFVDMNNLLKGVSPADRVFAPDNIYHGGISLYGKAVDFIKETGTNEYDETEYLKEKPLWIDSTFYTTKTKEEFWDWLAVQKQTQFTSTSYELIDNNCLTFVSKAVHFLGGEEAAKLNKQREFVKKNRDNPDFAKMMSAPPPTKKT